MKLKVAAIGGGFSSEKEISLLSVETVIAHLDEDKYDTYKVIIDNDGWVCQTADAIHEIDRADFSVPGLGIKFDFAFIMIHGTPGEDGVLQSYFELLNIPHSTCDRFMSTLTFNKWACNRLATTLSISRQALKHHRMFIPISNGTLMVKEKQAFFLKA